MSPSTKSQINKNNIVGVVLAGGRSQRMGGGDKFLIPLKHTNMLNIVLERLMPHLPTIIISTNGDLSRFQMFDYPLVSDHIKGNAGPLAGIYAGMRWAIKNRPDATHILTIGADSPLFPKDMITQFLIRANDYPEDIIMAKSNGRYHSIFALWPLTLRESLNNALAEKKYKIRAWSDKHPHQVISFENILINNHSIDPFFNVNTPDDLETLKTILFENLMNEHNH